MRYEQATFRILIGNHVEVEISIKGCPNAHAQVLPWQLGGVADVCARLTKAIDRIKKDEETLYGLPTQEHAPEQV